MTNLPPIPVVPHQINPPQTTPPTKSWWRRHWILMLVVGCVLLVVLFVGGIGGAIALGLRMMKRSDAAQLAGQQVRASAAVAEKLGSPIEEGWYAMGNINMSDGGGTAALSFPISGPKDEGTVYVEATRSMGKWSLDRVVVEIDRSGERIDVDLSVGEFERPPLRVSE